MGNLQVYFLVHLALLNLSLAHDCDVKDGTRQSPININTTQLFATETDKLVWSRDYFKRHSYDLINDGYTMEIVQSADSKAELSISGGELGVTYYFDSVHFHWGCEDDMGSEHLIDGKAFPMEMHVIHVQNTDPSRDTYAVVSVFLKKSYTLNRGLSNVTPKLKQAAENEHEIINLGKFALSTLVPTDDFVYYTYPGSLTTSPYTESVKWIIRKDPKKISRNQLESFREAAQIDEGLKNNYRDVQNLNGRIVREVKQTQKCCSTEK